MFPQKIFSWGFTVDVTKPQELGLSAAPDTFQELLSRFYHNVTVFELIVTGFVDYSDSDRNVEN